MYRLWFSPMSAAMAPCSVLEEIGVDYELLHLPWGVPRPPGYRRLQPLGRVPVLADGDDVVFEAAAIVMHLCDRHPEAGLAPAPGSMERARYYQWLVFYAASLHPASKPYNYASRFTDEPACEAGIRRLSARAVDEVLRIVDERLGTGPWVLGETYSACDHALHAHCSWIEAPEDGYVTLADYPNLAAFTTRVRDHSPGIRAMLSRSAAMTA